MGGMSQENAAAKKEYKQICFSVHRACSSLAQKKLSNSDANICVSVL